MPVKPILRMGNPKLLQVAEPVSEFNTKFLRNLILDMKDTMDAALGAGIAAPQIDVPYRVVIFGGKKSLRYPDADVVPYTELVNPTIEVIDASLAFGIEGCLSVPGLRGRVGRPRKIRYRGMDPTGASIDRVVEGFHARVVQHECDHLDGILFPFRLQDLRELGFEREICEFLPPDED